MRVIPVIDLKDGVVVRGVAGRRELYRPVESVLDCSAAPETVADAFVSQFGFQTAYVADLDAIGGAEPNWQVYESIASAGLRLVIDAGIGCRERATRLAEWLPTSPWCRGIVFGLESIRCEQDLTSLCDVVGRERAVFSLDLHQGKPLTDLPNWGGAAPMSIADAAVGAGFQRLIVLDLASVGVGEGVAVSGLCAEIRSRHPRLEITAGGGVRHHSDLAALARAGCDNALVASALHDGRLSKQDLVQFQPP